MTNKDYNKIWYTIKFLAIACLGLAVGGLITSLRYDSEIRTDQIELKVQIAKIIADKAMINDLVNELVSQIEAIKIERKSLGELKILLSKGE